MSATIIRLQDVQARHDIAERNKRVVAAVQYEGLVKDAGRLLGEAVKIDRAHDLTGLREEEQARAARRKYLKEFVGREVTEEEAEFAGLIAARLQSGPARPPSRAHTLGPCLWDGVQGWLKRQKKREAVHKAAVTRARKKRAAAKAKGGTERVG